MCPCAVYAILSEGGIKEFILLLKYLIDLERNYESEHSIEKINDLARNNRIVIEGKSFELINPHVLKVYGEFILGQDGKNDIDMIHEIIHTCLSYIEGEEKLISGQVLRLKEFIHEN